MNLQHLTLVLNASYEPINVVAARRALCMIVKEKAVVEAYSGQSVRTGVGVLRIPSVIRLRDYRRIPRQSRTVSRKTLLMRDRYTCQYCGARKEPKSLTLDHVIPESRKGPNTWENLVASCKPCNNRKADRTPEEAGMKLLHKPAQIGIHAKFRLMIDTADESAWGRFLFV
jgi:5-methylcytosine-specific restriction endonuclease McrA